MSAAMLAFKKMLPRWQQYPLPPRELTTQAADRVGLGDEVRKEPQSTLATAVGHFGYAAVCGSAYGLILQPLRLPVLLKGILFALGVWAGSYLGWIPALGFMPSATRQPRERNLLMIVSHLIWGISSAYAAEQVLEKEAS
jgi:putative membrane protein